MFKHISKVILLSFIFLSSLSAYNSSEKKFYVDSEELNYKNDKFYIHQGGNMWVSADTVHTDDRGVYVYETDLSVSAAGEFVKKWKCPYCHEYWPIGTSCQNPDCPSTYP